MVVKIPKACNNCGHVTDEDKCPLCGGETSKDWQGYVIIVDHQRSEIAKKMGIHVNGMFGLRVRFIRRRDVATPGFAARVSPMADVRPHTGAEHLADDRTREPGGDGRGFLHP